jgi:hypothetical protein
MVTVLPLASDVVERGNPVGMSVAKTLFALSGNSCAYTGCEQPMANPLWKHVNGQIAHICGERPGAPRYLSSMTAEERSAFENLILLCPGHHHLIDQLDPETHSVERLRDMKQRHEGRWKRSWAADDEIERYARLALSVLVILDDGAPSDPQNDLAELFGDPYGLDRGPGYLTLTVPKNPTGDNGSGSLYSHPEQPLGVKFRALENFAISHVGHLLGVHGTVDMTIRLDDIEGGDPETVRGVVDGTAGVPIYQGQWNWFDVRLNAQFRKGRTYVVTFVHWSIATGAPLNANNWNYMLPFLRDTEGRAYSRPYNVGGLVRVLDGTFHGSRITGVPPMSLALS